MLRLLWAPGPFPKHRADSTCSGMPLSACSCDVQTIHTCFRLFTFLLSIRRWASFLPFPGNYFFQFASFMLTVYQTHLQSEYPTDYVLWRARNFKSFCICRAEVTPLRALYISMVAILLSHCTPTEVSDTNIDKDGVGQGFHLVWTSASSPRDLKSDFASILLCTFHFSHGPTTSSDRACWATAGGWRKSQVRVLWY